VFSFVKFVIRSVLLFYSVHKHVDDIFFGLDIVRRSVANNALLYQHVMRNKAALEWGGGSHRKTQGPNAWALQFQRAWWSEIRSDQMFICRKR